MKPISIFLLILIIGSALLGSFLLLNHYNTASQELAAYQAKSKELSDALDKQVANIQTADDQAAAYQKAQELKKFGQDELNEANNDQQITPDIVVALICGIVFVISLLVGLVRLSSSRSPSKSTTAGEPALEGDSVTSGIHFESWKAELFAKDGAYKEQSRAWLESRYREETQNQNAKKEPAAVLNPMPPTAKKATRFFIFKPGDEDSQGPFDLSQIEALRTCGVVTPDTQFCREGENEWIPTPVE